MTDITVRLAGHDDVQQLVEMRRDFTFEEFEGESVTDRPGFVVVCAVGIRIVAQGL